MGEAKSDLKICSFFMTANLSRGWIIPMCSTHKWKVYEWMMSPMGVLTLWITSGWLNRLIVSTRKRQTEDIVSMYVWMSVLFVCLCVCVWFVSSCAHSVDEPIFLICWLETKFDLIITKAIETFSSPSPFHIPHVHPIILLSHEFNRSFKLIVWSTEIFSLTSKIVGTARFVGVPIGFVIICIIYICTSNGKIVLLCEFHQP